MNPMNIYDQHLERNPANFVAMSPVSFVERSAEGSTVVQNVFVNTVDKNGTAVIVARDLGLI